MSDNQEFDGIVLPSGSKLSVPTSYSSLDGPLTGNNRHSYYKQLSSVVENYSRQYSSYFFDVSFCLFEMYRLHMFMMMGFKNIYELSAAKFGIQRGTCSEMVSVWNKFSAYDKKIGRHVLDKYFVKFSGSQLCSLVHADMNVDMIKKVFSPEMSVRDIKRKLKEIKASRQSIQEALFDSKTDPAELNKESPEPEVSASEVRDRIASCTARFQLMMDHLAYKPKAVGYYEDYSSFEADLKQLEAILPDLVSGQDKIAIVHFRHSN